MEEKMENLNLKFLKDDKEVEDVFLALLEEKLISLESIENQTEKIVKKAIKASPKNILFIEKQEDYYDLIKKEVKKDGILLKFVKEAQQTEELILLALKQNIEASKFISSPLQKNNKAIRSFIKEKNLAFLAIMDSSNFSI
jgi:predicted rRNA methylase YqxC with S4 and FtsJ domains